MAAKKIAFILRLTNPAGQSVDIPVPPSLSIRMEERTGQPLWARVDAGFTGAFARFGYEAGRENGFIPESVSFEDFVDADPGWTVDIENVPPLVPAVVAAVDEAEAVERAGE